MPNKDINDFFEFLGFQEAMRNSKLNSTNDNEKSPDVSNFNLIINNEENSNKNDK